MRQLFAFIVFLFFACSTYGQNMVLNAGFEQYYQCPFGISQLLPQYLPDWTNGTNTTCDYYHTCGSGGGQVPLTQYSYQHPYSGNAFSGGFVYSTSGTIRDYIRGNLSPLIPGTYYEATIHVCLANWSGYAIANFGFFFYDAGIPVNTNTQGPLNVQTQVDYTAYGVVTDTVSWTARIDTFFADSAYTKFFLGNFYSDNLTTVVYHAGIQSWSYYFYDSIIVKPLAIPPLSGSLSSTPNVCYNGNSGTATAIPSGGLPPYSYLWSNGQTTQTAVNLSIGSYTCTITDAANATVTDTVSITSLSTQVVSTVLASSAATCGQQNGSISVSASGGTPGYTYQWSPYGGTGSTAFNLGGGTYTCIVTDANGCSDTVSTSLQQTPAFTLSMLVVNPNCYGQSTGSATVTLTGGTQPFTYLWNNGQTTQTATNLAAGTYSVTVTDGNGCTGTASVTINQPPLLTASIASSINNNCFGLNMATATVSATGGTPGYTYLWSTGQTSATASGLSAGTHTVTVTDTKGCTTTATVTITQPPLLNLTTTSINNTSCAQSNGSATVSASGGTPGYTYSWSPYGGTGTSASNLGAGLFIVTVTDTKGCTDTVHITISTSTALTVFFSASANVGCYGQSTGSATAMVTGGNGPYTYNWNNGGNTASINNVPAGIYSVTVTDQNGCAGIGSINITQPPQLVATASGNNINCAGQSTGSATVSVSGGTPGYTYLWSNGATTSSISGLVAGSYSVTVTDTKGCTDTAQVTITQNSPLIVAINSASATCSQNNGWATATVTGGVPPYTYSWSNGQITQTSSNLGAGTFTVNVTDANGCTGAAAVVITQSASLTLNIASDDISCNGAGDGSATVYVSTGTLPYTYNWSNGGTTSSVNNLLAGTYTVTVTDAINCQGTATVTITEPAALDATILSSSDVLCYGGATGAAEVAAAGGTAPYTYMWNNSGTVALQNSLVAGNYVVVVTDTNGCTDSASVIVSEPPILILSAQALSASCVGEAQGSAEVVASGGTVPYTYSWNSNPVQTTSTASNIPPGGYTVTVTDANGCTETAAVAITPHPLPGVDAGDDTVYCPGKDILTLHATGADSYVWSPAAALSCTACADPVAAPTTTTTYIVTGTDVNGCQGSDDITISVVDKQPTSVGADKHICTGESTELFAEGGIQYWWSPAEGLNYNTAYNPTASPEQTTVYTVIIKQNDCYTDTLSQLVTVHTMPDVSLGPDIKAMSGTSIDLHADTSNGISITWTPPFNLSCDNCVDPTAFIEKDIRYVATVTNGGCTAVDDILIRTSCAETDVFLPNSFTPNLDGNNDYFYPQSGITMVIEYMAIYDRWGEKIFEREKFIANEAKEGWDGSYKGRILDPAVYVYYVQFICGNGQKILLKGDIAIVK
ncbi:MAG TPA: gliding motility-associated C-terminal domain-containing protein [Flavipsychrobacter sp.]|nr:gliding motility-associated C-terminal domain-containing protein [Flavipsychrobacter sp.]